MEVFQESAIDVATVETFAAKLFGQDPTVRADAEHVAARVLVPRLGHLRQCKDHNVLEEQEILSPLLRQSLDFLVPRGDLLLDGKNIPQGVPHAEVQLHAGTQFLDVDRFDKVIVGAKFMRPQLLLAQGMAGDHEHLGLRACRRLLDATTGLVAIDAGHGNVQEHDVRHETGQHAEGLFASGGLLDDIIIPQASGNEATERVIIVNDQDSRSHVPPQGSLSSGDCSKLAERPANRARRLT